ncbi:hypothetical protein V8C26DRAFT_107576 [Trichoderma gracile]
MTTHTSLNSTFSIPHGLGRAPSSISDCGDLLICSRPAFFCVTVRGGAPRRLSRLSLPSMAEPSLAYDPSLLASRPINSLGPVCKTAKVCLPDLPCDVLIAALWHRVHLHGYCSFCRCCLVFDLLNPKTVACPTRCCTIRNVPSCESCSESICVPAPDESLGPVPQQIRVLPPDRASRATRMSIAKIFRTCPSSAGKLENFGAAMISAAPKQREPESSGWRDRSWCRHSKTDTTSLVREGYVVDLGCETAIQRTATTSRCRNHGRFECSRTGTKVQPLHGVSACILCRKIAAGR